MSDVVGGGGGGGGSGSDDVTAANGSWRMRDSSRRTFSEPGTLISNDSCFSSGSLGGRL